MAASKLPLGVEGVLAKLVLLAAERVPSLDVLTLFDGWAGILIVLLYGHCHRLQCRFRWAWGGREGLPPHRG